MKKFFTTAIFLFTILFARQVFAECTISATSKTDKILASATGCPVLTGDERYRIVFTSRPISKMVPAEYIYGGSPTVQVSEAAVGNPTTTFESKLNANIFNLFYLYKFKDAKEKNIANGTQILKEIPYVPTTVFEKFTIGPKDTDGNTLITGGATGAIGFDIGISEKPDYSNPLPPKFLVESKDVVAGKFSVKVPYDKFFPNVGSIYYAKQIAKFPTNTAGVLSSTTDPALAVPVNAIYGSNIKQQASDLEEKSYGLLSSIPDKDGKPSLTFYDPGSKICTQQKGLCSFSEVLNFVIKIAIGLAVVALVIRIMYQGFIYMTSDIPGVKLQAKGSIMDMALGLLIALGSWVILNTINPTLVNNTLSIDEVTVHSIRLTDAEVKERLGAITLGKVPAPNAQQLNTGAKLKPSITCYFAPIESEYGGSKKVDIKSPGGGTLVSANENFFNAVKIEGSGKLADGRIINIQNDKQQYSVVASPNGAYGPLVPMRSLAVDKNKIAPGSEVYIPYFDKKQVTYYEGSTVKTMTHDGLFYAVDVGSAILGDHLDVYRGFGKKNEQCEFGGGTTSDKKYLDIVIRRKGK